MVVLNTNQTLFHEETWYSICKLYTKLLQNIYYGIAKQILIHNKTIDLKQNERKSQMKLVNYL